MVVDGNAAPGNGRFLTSPTSRRFDRPISTIDGNDATGYRNHDRVDCMIQYDIAATARRQHHCSAMRTETMFRDREEITAPGGTSPLAPARAVAFLASPWAQRCVYGLGFVRSTRAVLSSIRRGENKCRNRRRIAVSSTASIPSTPSWLKHMNEPFADSTKVGCAVNVGRKINCGSALARLGRRDLCLRYGCRHREQYWSSGTQ